MMTEEEMQACLEAGDLPGTPSEAEAILLAYAFGHKAGRALLAEVEWVSQEGEMGSLPETCPICEKYRLDGHAPDCRLAAALRHGEEP